MAEVPSMFRTELWHPMAVHFPLALLGLAGVLGLLLSFIRRTRAGQKLRFTYSLLLWIGLLTFWIAFYLGELAYTIEVRRLCDPGVLKAHLRWSYICGTLFSVATALDLGWALLKHRLRTLLEIGSFLCAFAGAICLAYVGHLGASLVYQQGAGVHFPSEDCSEFE